MSCGRWALQLGTFDSLPTTLLLSLHLLFLGSTFLCYHFSPFKFQIPNPHIPTTRLFTLLTPQPPPQFPLLIPTPQPQTLAPVAVSYSFASSNCPSEYTFAAPRTALENAYLTQAMRRSDRDFDGHGAWVDFNSLDVEGCWTTGGPNATCPYREAVGEQNDLEKRVILVFYPGPLLSSHPSPSPITYPLPSPFIRIT